MKCVFVFEGINVFCVGSESQMSIMEVIIILNRSAYDRPNPIIFHRPEITHMLNGALETVTYHILSI